MGSLKKGEVYSHTFEEAANTPVLGNTFVKLVTDGAGGVQVATCGLHQAAFGVARFDAGDSGQTKQVTIHCGCRKTVIAGAAITPGDGVYVMSDATGRAIPYVAGAGVFANGIPRTSAAGAGADVEVYLFLEPCQP